MNQSAIHSVHAHKPGFTPGHQVALPPQQQAQAVRQLHEHAQRRMHLGMQLFDNAQKQSRMHQAMVDQLRQEQAQIRQQMQEDMARSLHAYDQWIGQVKTDFDSRLDRLDRRMSDLQQQWQAMAARVESMMSRAEVLFDQARMISEAAASLSRQTLISAPVTVIGSIKPTRPQTPASEPVSNSQPSHETANGELQPPPVKPHLVQTPAINEPTVRYLKLLELLQQNPPKQSAA